MHRVDNVLSLSTIPVVKIGTDMMCLPQKRSVSTPVHIIIITLAFHVANYSFYTILLPGYITVVNSSTMFHTEATWKSLGISLIPKN